LHSPAPGNFWTILYCSQGVLGLVETRRWCLGMWILPMHSFATPFNPPIHWHLGLASVSFGTKCQMWGSGLPAEIRGAKKNFFRDWLVALSTMAPRCGLTHFVEWTCYGRKLSYGVCQSTSVHGERGYHSFYVYVRRSATGVPFHRVAVIYDGFANFRGRPCSKDPSVMDNIAAHALRKQIFDVNRPRRAFSAGTQRSFRFLSICDASILGHLSYVD
jgi:hypothetical protein